LESIRPEYPEGVLLAPLENSEESAIRWRERCESITTDEGSDLAGLNAKGRCDSPLLFKAQSPGELVQEGLQFAFEERRAAGSAGGPEFTSVKLSIKSRKNKMGAEDESRRPSELAAIEDALRK
jgi:hypothetical protein